MRQTETSHFWLGRFPDQRRVAAYFAEVFDENDADREYTPLSQFAQDQGELWYDHDFLEHGFNKKANSIEKLVSGYSYSEQWSAELSQRAAEAGFTGINLIVFISQDQIDQPRSVRGEGDELHYLGKIKYRI